MREVPLYRGVQMVLGGQRACLGWLSRSSDVAALSRHTFPKLPCKPSTIWPPVPLTPSRGKPKLPLEPKLPFESTKLPFKPNFVLSQPNSKLPFKPKFVLSQPDSLFLQAIIDKYTQFGQKCPKLPCRPKFVFYTQNEFIYR